MSSRPARRSHRRRALLLLLTLIGPLAACSRSTAGPPGRSVHVFREAAFPARLYGRTRRIWIHSPKLAPGDSASLLVVFDGEQYLEDIPLPHMLDSLTDAGKIRPAVVVLIDNGGGFERRQDLANRAEFAAWLGDSLVPWVREIAPVSRDPRRATVCGSSAGGLAAAYVAYKRPDLFGNVLSQSGAFWRGNENAGGAPWEWLTAQYAGAPRKPIRFFLDVGSTETRGVLGGTGPPILDANRRLRDVLKAKGYEVLYTEVPGGFHAPESWATRLPEGLAAMLAP